MCLGEESQTHNLTWFSRCARPRCPVPGQNKQARKRIPRACDSPIPLQEDLRKKSEPHCHPNRGKT